MGTDLSKHLDTDLSTGLDTNLAPDALLPLTIPGIRFSYRPARANVTLDGSSNVELFVDEVTGLAINDFAQSAAGDRPAWNESGALGLPSVVGDASSDCLVNTTADWLADFSGDTVYTQYVLMTGSSGVANAQLVGGGSTSTTHNWRLRRAGSLVHQRQGASGANATGSVATSLSAWAKLSTTVGGTTIIADSLGGSASSGPNGLAPGIDILSMFCRVNTGVNQQFSDDELYWWFGYDRALTAAEESSIEEFLESYGGL